MTQGLNELFGYYERELLIGERLRKEFATRFPPLASAMGFDGSAAGQDPGIRNLVQSCALMNARIAMNIDRSKAEFTAGMLQVNYPHYNRPFAPATIVQFDAENVGFSLLKVPTIDRGTALHSAEVGGTRCQFRTVYDVKLAPLRVAEVQFIPNFTPPPASCTNREVTAAIRIAIEITSDRFEFTDPAIAQWRLFIDADHSQCACFRDTLFMRVREAWLSTGDSERLAGLEKMPMLPAGFRDDEALIPFETRSHPAYRYLTEYFCFPEKFNFVDIDFAHFRARSPQAAGVSPCIWASTIPATTAPQPGRWPRSPVPHCSLRARPPSICSPRPHVRSISTIQRRSTPCCPIRAAPAPTISTASTRLSD